MKAVKVMLVEVQLWFVNKKKHIMRWIILGLLVGNIFQAGIFLYTEKSDIPVHELIDSKTKILNFSVVKSITSEKMAVFSEPVCSIKLQSLSIRDKEYIANVKYKNKDRVLKKGQFIETNVSVHSISSLGIVLHHHEFLQSIAPIELIKISQQKISAQKYNPYPNPPPAKGFYEKNISDKYSNDIKVISNNVLSVNRALFKDILASREVLKTVSFGLSPSGGFQARKVLKDSIFSSLGIEEADILKSVNNTELKSVTDLMVLYQQKDNTNLIELRLERRGREMYYFYQLHD